MYDLLLMVTILLLFATIVTVFLYNKRLKRVHEEYEKAKDIVEEIVISFNRQVQELGNRLSLTDYKTEGFSSKFEKIEKKAQGQDQQLAKVTVKVEGLLEVEHKVASQIKSMSKRFEEVTVTQEKMMKKIQEIEKVEYNTPA